MSLLRPSTDDDNNYDDRRRPVTTGDVSQDILHFLIYNLSAATHMQHTCTETLQYRHTRCIDENVSRACTWYIHTHPFLRAATPLARSLEYHTSFVPMWPTVTHCDSLWPSVTLCDPLWPTVTHCVPLCLLFMHESFQPFFNMVFFIFLSATSLGFSKELFGAVIGQQWLVNFLFVNKSITKQFPFTAKHLRKFMNSMSFPTRFLTRWKSSELVSHFLQRHVVWCYIMSRPVMSFHVVMQRHKVKNTGSGWPQIFHGFLVILNAEDLTRELEWREL
jgi:hypothetical protein